MGATRHQRGRTRSGTPASTTTTERARARDGRRDGSRPRGAFVGGVALVLTSAALAGVPAQAIDGNPPTGPGNIEVFPMRDMVAIEGYGDQAGKQARIEVLRGGQVVGSAIGTVDASGFLEVNHPGGVCWGAGTDLRVTPDITGDDEIKVSFSDGHWDGMRTAAVAVTAVTRDDATRTLTIEGTYDGKVAVPDPLDTVTTPGRFGVEIVNPAMRDATSGIGERAIGWPTDDVPAGWSVTGSVTGTGAAADGTPGSGGAFAVTYTFGSVADLDLAHAGELVIQSWQAEPDPALGVEAQYGITLHEAYEHGGPGMGGCPAGPDELRPASPGSYTARAVDGGAVDVQWQPPAVTPGAPAVTGYTVRAVHGEDEIGKRLGVEATSTRLTGLETGKVYDIEVAARSDAGESWLPASMRVVGGPFVDPVATARTDAPTNGAGQYTRPLVTNANVDFGVYLDPASGMAPGARIYYTTNGAAATESSTPYVVGTPITIRQDTTLSWVIYDAGNIKGAQDSKSFDVQIANAPAAPPAPGVVAGDASATVSIPLIAGAEAYRVQAYDAAGIKVGSLLNVPLPTDGSPTASRRVAGLVNGTPYTFTAAQRVGTVWSDESVRSEVVTPVAAPRAVAGAAQTTRRGQGVTLDGSQSVGAVAYRWQQLRPAGTTTAPQDPLVSLSDATVAKPTFTFPRMTGPTTDHTLQFRLTITLADGTTQAANTTVTATPDVIVADRARWRAGDPLRMSGTGSQDGARLTFRDATANGALIGTATVSGGVWTAPAAVVNLSNGSIHVWSDLGYVGNIQTTR